MSNQRFVSATRFFTEAVLMTLILCGFTYVWMYLQIPAHAPWWALFGAPFYFGMSATLLMLTGAKMVEKVSFPGDPDEVTRQPG